MYNLCSRIVIDFCNNIDERMVDIQTQLIRFQKKFQTVLKWRPYSSSDTFSDNGDSIIA